MLSSYPKKWPHYTARHINVGIPKFRQEVEKAAREVVQQGILVLIHKVISLAEGSSGYSQADSKLTT